MTLIEANQRMAQVDCHDPDSVAEVLSGRAQALAEFASLAPPPLLRETLDAGEELRGKLEHTQIEMRRDLDRMHKLRGALQATLCEVQADQITCFG